MEGDLITGWYREGSQNHKRTLIQIYLPELQEVEVHSASSTRISGFNESENNLTLKVSGASEAHFTGSAGELQVILDGASLLSLNGEVENLAAEVQGASELRAKLLKTKAAQIEIHGNSHANVEVENSITGAVRGGSSLIYYGNPANIQVVVETGSSILHGD